MHITHILYNDVLGSKLRKCTRINRD